MVNTDQILRGWVYIVILCISHSLFISCEEEKKVNIQLGFEIGPGSEESVIKIKGSSDSGEYDLKENNKEIKSPKVYAIYPSSPAENKKLLRTAESVDLSNSEIDSDSDQGDRVTKGTMNEDFKQDGPVSKITMDSIESSGNDSE